MRFLVPLLFSFFLALTNAVNQNQNQTCAVGPTPSRPPSPVPTLQQANGCTTFSVGPGTGCAWMCSYCANALGTNNYYFTDNVCTYQPGGCVGNPQAGVQYTCCSA